MEIEEGNREVYIDLRRVGRRVDGSQKSDSVQEMSME